MENKKSTKIPETDRDETPPTPSLFEDDRFFETNISLEKKYPLTERYKKSTRLIKASQKEYSTEAIEKRLMEMESLHFISFQDKNLIIKRLSDKFKLLETYGYIFKPNIAEITYEEALNFDVARKHTEEVFEDEYGDLTEGEDGLTQDEVEDLKNLYAERLRLERLADVIEVSILDLQGSDARNTFIYQNVIAQASQLRDRLDVMVTLPIERSRNREIYHLKLQNQIRKETQRKKAREAFANLCEVKKQSISHQDFRIKVQNATSVAEVIQTINESGYLKGKTLGWNCFPSRLALKNLKIIANAFADVCERYPFVIGYVQNIICNPYLVYLLGLWFPLEKEVDISNRFLRNPSKSRIRKRDEVYHVFVHEMGHAVDSSLSDLVDEYEIRLARFERRFNSEYYRFSSTKCISKNVKRSVEKNLGITTRKKDLSAYALRNSCEWFAEAIAEYFWSNKPKPIAVEVDRVLGKVMQGDFSDLFK